MSQFAPQPPAYYGINDPPGTSPEGDPTHTPPAVVWFKAYAALVAMTCVGFLALSVFLMVAPAAAASKTTDLIPGLVMGGIYGLVSVVFGVPYVLALVLKPRKWVHTLHMVLIAFGFMHCCAWPFSIPLIIAYGKPEVKAWFGQQ